MFIEEIVSGKLIKTIGEKREFCRFKIPMKLLYGNEEIKILDISEGGIKLNKNINEIFIMGFILYKGEKIPCQLGKKHEGLSTSGWIFLKNVPRIKSILSPENISQEFTIEESKAGDSLVYTGEEISLKIKYNKYFKIDSLKAIIKNNIVEWSDEKGFKTGSHGDIDIYDNLMDISKIKFFQKVINLSPHFPVSFKNWISEKF